MTRSFVGTRNFICLSASFVAWLGAFAAPVASAQEQGPPDLRRFEESTPPLSDTIPNAWFGPGPLHRVLVDTQSKAATLARLASEQGLVRTHDYGSFALAVIDERAYPSRDALRAAGYEFHDENELVVFNEIVLRGQAPEATLSTLHPAFRMSAPNATALDPLAGLYVVQFDGPVQDAWLELFDRVGASFSQYVALNAYVVAVAPERVAELDQLARSSAHVQHVGLYEPGFRMHAELRRAYLDFESEPRLVTIQLIHGANVADAILEIEASAAKVVDVRRVGPYVNVRAEITPAVAQALALSPHVFQVEPQGVITRYDERQGQIMAGNVTATGPSAPGYLAFLAGLGFNSSQFTSFAVNVADDATSLTGHPDLASSRVAFSLNPTGQTGAQGGHGFLNAHIVGGFNDGTGTAVEDTGGYNYGLGVAPWARVGSTAIFGAGSATATSYESQAYGLGARISSNSWGFQTFTGGPVPDYDANSQEYDFIARDAQTGTAGNQQYLVVFAAGNHGSGTNTVSTPGTAKNIITVGAGENDRQTGTDGCGIGNTGANSWQDVISFSSRGPVNSSGGDGRWKPETIAPGTHIEAGVPQTNYDGSSVCNQYWPTGQTLYGWSSGTSHSCPAISGAAALIYQWFLNNGLAAPSPALNKAMVVISGQYMTGVGANDTLPSNSQGSGQFNLPRAIGAASRILEDQTQVLGASGATWSVAGNVADTSKPFRVALVWTDAPGPTTGAPYVNNLDLTVTVGATTYRGNVFSGANSISGGTADIRNNTELVFLPAGTSGAFTVTVTATSIAGDGVPGNADTTDQDFALVVYNGSAGAPVAPVANFTGTPTSGSAPLTVNFTDASTGSISSWAWDFGDTGTSTVQNPSHVYSTPGTYSVTLTVTGPGGSDALTRTNYVTVSAPTAPTADFAGTPTSGNAPLSVNFTDLSTGSITSWAWDFGDTGTSTAQNPNHVYTTPGTYSVTLTVTGPGGSNALTRTNYITVNTPPASTRYYVSFAANTTLPVLGTVADEDIVYYDTATGAWAYYFDGSDVGLSSTDIDAFHVRADGSILMSFDSTTFSVTGLTGGPSGTTVEDRDVIRFVPTSTGATTAGSFVFYFDGSDVGLTTSSSEDIDAISETAGGALLLSTLGNPSVTGLSGLADEDILSFTGTFGSATSGSFTHYFDGSDVGLGASSGGDIDGIGFVGGTGLVISTQADFTSGISWADEDLVRFTGTTGSATSGTFSIQLDLSTVGVPTGANVDGLTIVP
ncbi:MAG: PKD domain-containing protein [Planctomycetes bacterium]|nr:PKD domain-containing protein [Planctomycetota bacterium]